MYHHCLVRLPLVFSHSCSSVTCSRNISWSSYLIALSKSSPVLAVQSGLSEIHDFSGLPWWAVIAISTVSIRGLMTFPLAVHQHQVAAKLQNVRAELAKIAPALRREVSIAARTQNWDYRTTKLAYKKNMKHYYRKFIVEDNCHPFKGVLLVLVQLPVWICFSAALRNLSLMMPYHDLTAERIFNQFKSGGAMWFQDLTVADCYFLPVLICLTNLLLIEVHSLRNLTDSSLFKKILENGARTATLFVVVAAAFCPSSVSFYWLCSSMCGFLQNIVLMMPKARRALRIPLTATESATPFQDVYKNLKIKLSLK